MTNNTLTSPNGFLAAGLHCGIKSSGNFDIGLIVCPAGAKAAAMFTTNKITSAAVTICKKHAASDKIYAVVVNSGNANACTGTQGIRDAITMCRQVACRIEVQPHQVLVASTGIIGHKLPIKTVLAGINAAAKKLSATPQAGMNFSRAIMTTDTRPKTAIRQITLGNKKITIAGTTKGAGMIGPNMATTLCFVTTDAAISRPLLVRAWQNAIGLSLNRLTVDGHQSTNDTAIILSSGLAGNKSITKQNIDYKNFSAALLELCSDLAQQMALDAEGSRRMFTVVVEGAATRDDAAAAARAVADYDLVKCAVHGGDPNWGRIICAVGSCGVKLNPDKLSCKIGDIVVFKNGRPIQFDARRAGKIISSKHHIITVGLGCGKYCDFCHGCELGKDYVTINADYHT